MHNERTDYLGIIVCVVALSLKRNVCSPHLKMSPMVITTGLRWQGLGLCLHDDKKHIWLQQHLTGTFSLFSPKSQAGDRIFELSERLLKSSENCFPNAFGPLVIQLAAAFLTIHIHIGRKNRTYAVSQSPDAEISIVMLKTPNDNPGSPTNFYV